MTARNALIIGRFQPFHNGHLMVLKAMASKYSPVVAIGSAQLSHTADNPFTAGERYEMILSAVEDEGLQVRILPVPDPAMVHRPNDAIVHNATDLEIAGGGADDQLALPQSMRHGCTRSVCAL